MSDTFRKTYKEMTPVLKEALDNIKTKAEELELLFDDVKNTEGGRELALARTKLEECIMWAVKSLTK